jgi:hypothetical protein
VLIAVPATWLLARVADPSDPAQVPRAVLVVVALQLALLPLTNAISRRYEQEAELALARPQPPAWSHVLLDDHPTFLERIELAKVWKLRTRAGPSPGGPGSP